METSPAGPSRLPTITSEAEEQAAESGIVLNGSNTNGVNGNTNGTNGENGSGSGTVKKEEVDEGNEEDFKVDVNALPDEACVTLYIQNLNEKVGVPGNASFPSSSTPLSPSPPPSSSSSLRLLIIG